MKLLETDEERMDRWVKLLNSKIGKDLDDFFDEVDFLISGADISDDFKSDIVDNNIQNLLTRLQYDACVRFSQQKQMRQK